MVKWTVSRDSKIPLWIQLREQLRYLISTGSFGPGAKLPSIRELSSKAKVSINTVVRAFQDLEREGLIKSRVGDGSFVSSVLGNRSSPGSIDQLRELLHDTIIDASKLGFSFLDCLDQLQEMSRAFENRPRVVAWVECNDFELKVFAQMIQEQSGVPIRPVSLSQLRSRPQSSLNGNERVCGVLTSVFHVGEVKEILRDESLDVDAVFTNTSPENLALIREASRGKRVIFAFRKQENVKFMTNLVKEACPHALQIECHSLETDARCQEFLEQADVIIASGPVYAEIVSLAGAQKKVFHLLDRVDPLSIQLIRQLYAT